MLWQRKREEETEARRSQYEEKKTQTVEAGFAWQHNAAARPLKEDGVSKTEERWTHVM